MLPEDFVPKFAPAAGFRDILVHMYTDIDVERVYGYLQKNLDDIKLFGRLVAL
ncbi:MULTISPECIES: HepT-like ribonuclease domain-containing protein [Methanothermobacter]|uniref:DUF86 domain-containing protein n=1 Tax=Methanothermobacter wolfeii TaxID=145261 RepID=A0A9E7RR93_METWO|nr:MULTISPECIES: HepT-like ribonuclease domain-containing protein [Methanothermobacter]UXH30896.1 DUF86 domain-containing protein [Methanothermobacter wolfeii]